MAWTVGKPAGADAANTIDNSVIDNNTALDTWASAFTDGINQAGAVIYKMYRSANAVIAKFRAAAGDTFDRFTWDLNGKQEWGSGSAAQDIAQERLAAKLLGLGTGQDYAGALDRTTSTVEVVNSTAIEALYTFALPGNILGTNRAVRLVLTGDFLNDSGVNANTTIIATYSSGVTLSTNTLTHTTNVDRRAFRYELELYANGATNAQQAWAQMWTSLPQSSGTAGTMATDDNIRRTSVRTGLAVDSTSAQTIQVTAQHNAAHASLSIRKLKTVLKVM